MMIAHTWREAGDKNFKSWRAQDNVFERFPCPQEKRKTDKQAVELCSTQNLENFKSRIFSDSTEIFSAIGGYN